MRVVYEKKSRKCLISYPVKKTLNNKSVQNKNGSRQLDILGGEKEG